MPDLLLAIKETVDSDPRPGRFLLAGSARLLGLRGLPDIVPGRFPESIARAGRRRERFLASYVADIINRDVIQLWEIERGPEMRALTRPVAARSGQLLIAGTLADALGLSQPTVKRHLSLWKRSS